MDGIKLACRYSFRPNMLGLCGPEKAFKLFYYVVGKGYNRIELKRLLQEFIGAFTYYRLIAKANKIADPFDYQVVEAYWIGNDLLKNVKAQAIKKMIISDFAQPGLLNKKIALSLAGKLPSGLVPHHSFHVFYLGSLTGVVPKDLKTFNACSITWGQVKKIDKENLVVTRSNLRQKNKKLIFSRPVYQKVLFKINNQSFVKNPRVGDFVSIHWNWACDKLSKRSLESLKYWTNHNLKIINKIQ